MSISRRERDLLEEMAVQLRKESRIIYAGLLVRLVTDWDKPMPKVKKKAPTKKAPAKGRAKARAS